MLYKIDLNEEPSSALTPVEFFDMETVERVERDLEHIIANNLVDVLFQEARLMPIFQERPMQEEADVYAVDPDGNLVIFELKRGTADKGAVHQLLRYSQRAGQWDYGKLDEMYRKYVRSAEEAKKPQSLQEAHREAHGLQEPLQTHEFNGEQHLRVVGNAADDSLIDSVDYWKSHGLAIDFVPYRLYELDYGEQYFEFFSFPYDRHRNPAEVKGVLFDTNASWSDESVWEMMENGRVAAYGGASRFADHVTRGDLVFFYHKGKGIIAAGRVTSDLRKIEEKDKKEWYREVEFVTPAPERSEGIQAYMPASDVEDVTGQSFFWARTIKVPYLDRDEARVLLNSLREKLE